MTHSNNQQPTILWLLQNNQVTPLIAQFLKLFKSGMGKVNIQFIAPAMDEEVLGLIKELDPATFQASRKNLPPSEDVYKQKRDLIAEGTFKDGLEIWKTLILDDLGAGVKSETALSLPRIENIHGIILQIPTPLGSANPEEILFYEWLNIARKNNVFIAGYELLPLCSRWTLIPSMLDGIITNNEMSYQYLKSPKTQIKGKIWKLPRHEGKTFSPGTGVLWQNGLQAPYHYRAEHKIPKDKVILFLPHNVALTYEYRRLLEEIQEYGDQIHLMFCIGKDQVRGTHSHEQTVEIICKKALKKFHSYSFHDLTMPWEMVMADAVVSISLCYSTTVAEANGIPCIVMDEIVPENRSGYLLMTDTWETVRTEIAKIIALKQHDTPLVDIIYEIIHQKHPKISYENGQ